MSFIAVLISKMKKVKYISENDSELSAGTFSIHNL